jgi:hypothetical protein
MRISQRSVVASVAVTLAVIAYMRATTKAQQPEPLRLTAPSPHALQQGAPPARVLAQAQTQTAQGELLDVDVKAGTLTIQTPTTEMTFRFNDETRVSGAQKGAAGLATVTGSIVTVQFRKEGQMNLATAIDVKPAK